MTSRKPNLLFIFADQWRAQATGYAGDPNVNTPHLDRLSQESIVFTKAISGCSVCCPYRASLLTGQYPLTHGVFTNDVPLQPSGVSMGEAFKAAAYDTAYIGKWHVDGRGRRRYIPRERRLGFDYWRAIECIHDYNESHYYADEDVELMWEGYDAIAQTREARRYLETHEANKPFVLFLSWGPPHDPYPTAPEKYRAMFNKNDLMLRDNVPLECQELARERLAGYYAHIAALDDCLGQIVAALKDAGLEDNTILVFTSDHGDMLGSHGQYKKQQPYDESIRVPFLLRFPKLLGTGGREIDMPFDSPDVMPTVLGLCGIDIPDSVEGHDFSGVITGAQEPMIEEAILTCPMPFGEWNRAVGGKEYRGLRTRRYTYVRDLAAPWLLFDNERDPYQMVNLCSLAEHRAIQEELDRRLSNRLAEINDTFLPAQAYLDNWGYVTDETGTVPYGP